MRDVIVIGAGGGGPVVAKELAARGLDVLLLEAGPYWDSEKEWTHHSVDAGHPALGFLRFGPHDRNRPSWRRELAANGLIYQLSGVGGTTQHYFGNSPRAMPGAFIGHDGPDRDLHDLEHLFPFSYDELRPYYDWVEATLPVQTAPMGTKDELFIRGAQRIGLALQKTKDIAFPSFRPQENAILQPGGTAGKTRDAALLVHPQASGCTFCGYCIVGCNQPRRAPRNLKAKRSTDNSYTPMALTADAWAAGGKAITLVTDAFATKIEMDGRRARRVTWRVNRTGELVTEEAKVVVMSAGCTENPRLWINSGLPNPNDWVGRGYTYHFPDGVAGICDFDTECAKGAGSNARCDFPGYGSFQVTGFPPAFGAATLGFSDSGVRGHYDNGRGFTSPERLWDGPTGRPVGLEFKRILRNINRLLNIEILTDDDVESFNRVTVSTVFKDEHGPAAKVEIFPRRASARTVRNREFLAAQACKILRAAGAHTVVRLDVAGIIAHFQSTMRMGLDERTSVLDANARARFVEGLYIADNSALANAVGGPNPTLTTQALATRTAEKIFVNEFGGDPWVGRETPVSSLDGRVTAACMASNVCERANAR